MSYHLNTESTGVCSKEESSTRNTLDRIANLEQLAEQCCYSQLEGNLGVPVSVNLQSPSYL